MLFLLILLSLCIPLGILTILIILTHKPYKPFRKMKGKEIENCYEIRRYKRK